MAGSDNRSRIGRYSTAGLQFIIPFAALTVLGIWIDRKLHTLPGFTINGAVIGFVAGVLRLRQLARAARDEQRGEDEPE